MRISIFLAAGMLATTVAQAQNYGDVLPAGKFIKSGEYMRGQGKYAILRTDGNFCTHWGASPAQNGGEIGCISSKGFGQGPYFALMQDDGNFCIYRGTDPANRKEGYVWCRAGKREVAPGPYRLVFRSDGDLHVQANGGLVWAMDGRSGITTWNNYSDKYVWITVYNMVRAQLDYGCVKPKQSRKWTHHSIQKSGPSDIFYVRAQVMQTPDCKGTQYCDTTGEIYGANTLYVNEDKAKKSCFVDKYAR